MRLRSPVPALLLVLTLLLTLLAGSAGAAPPGQPAASPPAVTASHKVTLVTGDVVRLDVLSGGGERAVVTRRAGTSAWYRTFSDRGDAYVIPSAALPLLASDRLDLALFNVSGLVEQRYDDAHRDTLPLIVDYGRPGARSLAATPAPAGARASRPLDSIGALAVAADKDQAQRFWEGLASDTGGVAGLARLRGGASKVWLDARVEGSLDESVPLIGGPAAWARGLDGSGVTAAVLDSGIDATHPDFEGRIGETRDFTGKGSVVDGLGHGTHVASILAGSGAASGGRFRGVAPGAELVIGKVLDDFGFGQMSWVIAGMEWAAPRADVVNLSLGGPQTRGDDPASQALDALTAEHGTLFVVAAGNRGPHESQTHYVTSPAVASSALAVGASRDDFMASFSRDQVMGTSIVKPELAAPGWQITAARAAGTGCCGDDRYTSNNGTSMATPHAAGAAAILVQQHPGWSPAEVKTALVSTANPLEFAGAYQQGGGRLDVDRATRQTVRVSRGVLDMGHFTRPFEPGEQQTSQTLTYTNDGGEPVTLALTTSLERESGDPVPAGHLTVTPSEITLAPGASADVQVSLDATGLEGNSYRTYGGRVEARGGGQQLGTAVGFVKEGDTVDVTFRALDRHGQPAFASLRVRQYKDFNTGGYFPQLLFLNPSQTEWTLRLPENVYSYTALIATLDESGRFARELSVVGDPELEVGPPAFGVTIDARTANPLTVRTPRPSEPRGLALSWVRGGGTGRAFEAYWFPRDDGSPEQVSVAPTEPVAADPFILLTSFETGVPIIRAEARWPRRSLDVVHAGGPRVDGTHDLAVVDAGTAAPEDLDGKDLAGKLALVRESAERSWADQVIAVWEAGGTAMALHSDQPGVFWPELQGAPITVLSLPRDDGEWLRERLGRRPLSVRLRGTPSTPYAYELAFAEHGRVPGDLSYRADHGDLAKVEVRLHTTGAERGPDPGTWRHESISSVCACGTFSVLDRPAPGRVRTEYVTADPELSFGRDLLTPELGFFKRFAAPSATGYRRGEHVTDDWLQAPLVPGLPNSARDTRMASVRLGNRVRYNLATWRDSAGHWTSETFGLDVTSRLFREGEEEPLRESNRARDSALVPEGPGRYRLEFDTAHDGTVQPLSTSTHTVWEFASDVAGTFEDPAELPMVDLRATELTSGWFGGWSALGLDNSARDWRFVALHLQAGHQLGSEAAPVDRVRVSVSFDDGGSWHPVWVTRSRHHPGSFTARYWHPPIERTSGYVSLKLEASDGDGNTFEQTVTHAYRLED